MRNQNKIAGIAGAVALAMALTAWGAMSEPFGANAETTADSLLTAVGEAKLTNAASYQAGNGTTYSGVGVTAKTGGTVLVKNSVYIGDNGMNTPVLELLMTPEKSDGVITGWAEAASDEEKQLLQVTGYRTEDYIPGSACASYTISPVLNTEELTNYSITIVTDELVVSPRHVTITVPDLDNIYYDENIGIDRVYEEAIAGGLSDLIDDGVRDIVTFTPSVTLQRDTAVGNYTVSGSKHNANYTVEFVYTGEGSSTYAIRAADMQEAVYEAYNGIYDSEAHAVLNTGYHVTTRNDQTATWYFRLSEEDEWETDLTLTDAGTYTVYFYIAAPNHNDYGSSTQNSEEYSFQVVIKQYELSIKADGTITYGYDFDTEKDYTLSYQYGAGSWTQERPFGESLREMGLADEGGNLLLTVAAGTYQIGMDAESYPITLGAGSVVFDTLNYNISLEEGVLTVARREITIHINDTKGENVGSTYGNPFNPVSAEVTSEEKIYAKDGAWNDLITLSVLGPYWGVPENPFYDYTANSDDQLRAPAGDDYVIVASLLDGTSVNYNIIIYVIAYNFVKTSNNTVQTLCLAYISRITI